MQVRDLRRRFSEEQLRFEEKMRRYRVILTHLKVIQEDMMRLMDVGEVDNAYMAMVRELCEFVGQVELRIATRERQIFGGEGPASRGVPAGEQRPYPQGLELVRELWRPMS